MIPKYRAYSKKTKTIFPVEELYWRDGIELRGASLANKDRSIWFQPIENIELMQWIGSYDSYENEIYEHQILMLTDSFGYETYHLVMRGDSEYPAFYLDPGFKCEINDFSYLYNCGEYTSKVVGTKFTTPELLEGAGCE